MDEHLINKKIEDTMHSIVGVSKASPAPFFFTRLEARMLMEKNTWYQLSSFFAKPVVAFACICFVIMINLAVIFATVNAHENHAKPGNDIAAMDEYSQVTTSLYEFDK